MRGQPFFRGLLRALFVLYCVEAGLFLVFVPWREGWQRLLTEFPIASVRSLLLLPISRGAITGFGLIHLVWGLHDLQALFRRPVAQTDETACDESTAPGLP